MSNSENSSFKTCSLCNFVWKTRDQFLHDPQLSIIGYQANFHDLKEGLFLFNHNCETTIALPVGLFLDLYDGPTYTERKTGSKDCPGHCLYKTDIQPCPAKCECSFVREILQIVGKQIGQKSAA